MIVRSETGSLLLITQPDHAALARRIMEQGISLASTERRDSILYAVAEHDNGWREPDMAPSVDPATGGLHDFVSVPVDVRQAVWPRGVARVAADPWAAALVAQHARTVYSRFRTSPEWEAFFGEMERVRDTYLHKAGATLDQLRRDYVFLRLGDLASLTFCNGWTEEQRYEGWTIRLDGARLLITPDPFGGRDVPLAVTARELPNRRFASDADAAAVYRSAKEVMCSGMAVGVPEPCDVVRRWVAAVNASDMPTVMTLSAGDIEVGGPRGSGRGQPLLRDWIERTRIHMTTQRAFASEGHIVLLQHAAWRDPKGTPIAEALIANRFVVAHGRVASVVRCDDLADALRDAQLTDRDEVRIEATE